jgi:hypothetical protein
MLCPRHLNSCARHRWQHIVFAGKIILCLFNISPVLTIWYIHLYIVCVHMIVLYQYTTSESYAVHSSKGAAPRFKRPPAPRPSRGCMDAALRVGEWIAHALSRRADSD